MTTTQHWQVYHIVTFLYLINTNITVTIVHKNDQGYEWLTVNYSLFEHLFQVFILRGIKKNHHAWNRISSPETWRISSLKPMFMNELASELNRFWYDYFKRILEFSNYFSMSYNIEWIFLGAFFNNEILIFRTLALCKEERCHLYSFAVWL